MSKTTVSTSQQEAAACPKTKIQRSRMDYNSHIESIRKDEYPMIGDDTYLDHAGTTLPAKRLMESFTKSMMSTIVGNPHSAHSSSQLPISRIEDIRSRVLQLFDADPAEFDLVFVPNATAGVKLVVEALRAAQDGFDYLYHQSSHTSLVGVRQEARHSVCLDDAATKRWLAGGPAFSDDETQGRLLLFSYPAQSNLDGSRLPLEWIGQSRSREASRQCLTLLDASAYVSTTPLSFACPHTAPDFTVFSFYKIFGFPDLGGLIVRRARTSHLLLNRKYFGGGTVEVVTCHKEDSWHRRKTQILHEALEDGTLPVHSIVALDIAMETHTQLFGSMREVSSHASYLADLLESGLATLQHQNGTRACDLYSQRAGKNKGPIVAFNLLTDTGTWVSPSKFQELAILKGFHIRTGGVCNPGGTAAALELTAADIEHNFAQGYRCGSTDDIFRGRPAGLIRVSFGAMNTFSDVDKFIGFVREFYTTRGGIQRSISGSTKGARRRLPEVAQPSQLLVQSIAVFPIKSCQGFAVPREMKWNMTTKGLAWDREWCLLSRATNRILTQKRYPRMALLLPYIKMDENIMVVNYNGGENELTKRERSIALPLIPGAASRALPQEIELSETRVVGMKTPVRKYTSESVNSFFSTVLGTPCILARVSHVSDEMRSRASSAMPGAFPDDDDTDAEGTASSGSLSNESPILAINMSSVNRLNQQIELAGAEPVLAEAFRANIVFGSALASSEEAYLEDGWSQLRIGSSRLRVFGKCQRCHMVCIDPRTATKRPEPYVTLSKTRRVGGKVLFGCHLALAASSGAASLKIGDAVTAYV